MNYIRSVHVARPGTSNHHITHVRWSTTPAGPLTTTTREQVHAWIVDGYTFRSLSPQHTQADVVAKVSPAGTRYIATVADGQETNNLLSLPQF